MNGEVLDIQKIYEKKKIFLEVHLEKGAITLNFG